MESINLEYISLGDCSALTVVQKDGWNASIIQLQLEVEMEILDIEK